MPPHKRPKNAEIPVSATTSIKRFKLGINNGKDVTVISGKSAPSILIQQIKLRRQKIKVREKIVKITVDSEEIIDQNQKMKIFA